MSHLRFAYQNGLPVQGQNPRFRFAGEAWMSPEGYMVFEGQELNPGYPGSSAGHSGLSYEPRSNHSSVHYSKSLSSRSSTRSSANPVHSYECQMKNEALQRSGSSTGYPYSCSCSPEKEGLHSSRSSIGSAHSYSSSVRSDPFPKTNPWSSPFAHSYSSPVKSEPVAKTSPWSSPSAHSYSSSVKSEPIAKTSPWNSPSAHSYSSSVKSEPIAKTSPWNSPSAHSYTSVKKEEPFQQQQHGSWRTNSSCSSGSDNPFNQWNGRLRPRPVASPRAWTESFAPEASRPAAQAHVPFNFTNFNVVIPGRPRI